jgi:aminoglycoside 2''-phosphotransferase
MNNLQSYEKRIREIARDVTITSATLNSDGLLNDVVIVNGEMIFRFPKHEYGFKHLKDETNILRLLKNHITLEIPAPLYQSDDCLAYRLIPGETLRRDMLLKLSEDEQQAVADQLAQFFKELHGIPVKDASEFEIPMADALMKYEGWLRVYERKTN